MYTALMQVTITEFRRNLFTLVEQAMNGTEVHVTHKGKSFTLKPDEPPPGRIARLTPTRIINGSLDGANDELMNTMQAEWDQDWAKL